MTKDPDRVRPDRSTAWPRRGSDGRIATFRHLLEAVAVLLVVGLLAVTVIDLLSTWVGIGDLGGTSGWLGGLMAFWLYVEEFRAWLGSRNRLLLALLGGVISFGTGILVGGLVTGWPTLLGGGLAVAVAAFTYAPIWFFGIRVMGEKETDR
jgi:hypothetical protein